MRKFIIKKSEEINFSRGGADGYAFPIKNKNIEIDFIDSKTGHGGKVVSDSLTHFYYILEGSGEFIIDNKSYFAITGDLVEILPKHSFDYKGRMKMLLIMEPPYSSEKVKESK
jgi:mannose-6-phosphate isomerase-like protein (cupin superfamily)